MKENQHIARLPRKNGRPISPEGKKRIAICKQYGVSYRSYNNFGLGKDMPELARQVLANEARRISRKKIVAERDLMFEGEGIA